MQSVDERPRARQGAPRRPPARRAAPRRPTRAARLCITATTAGLVLLGAGLAPSGQRVAATAGDPVTGAVLALTGLGGPDRAAPAGPAAPAPPAPAGAAAPAAPAPAAAAAPAPAPSAAVRREPVREPAPVSRTGTGALVVVPGTDAPPGEGPVRRYLVEVEQGLGVDPAGFARTVHATLNDARSWAAGSAMAFERVDAADAERVAFRVALASAATTDRLCAPLATHGELSCHNGGRAVLNVVRWLDGVQGHPDLTVYRQYLVNHEVGHALGHRHVGCPGPGEPAPVMQQQSVGVAPCRPNAWPYPGGGPSPG